MKTPINLFLLLFFLSIYNSGYCQKKKKPIQIKVNTDLIWELSIDQDSLINEINIFKTQSVSYVFLDSVFTDSIVDNTKYLLFNISFDGNNLVFKELDPHGKENKCLVIRNRIAVKNSVLTYKSDYNLQFKVSLQKDKSGLISSISFIEQRTYPVKQAKNKSIEVTPTNEITVGIQFDIVKIAGNQVLLLGVSELKGATIQKSLILNDQKIVGGYNY